MNTRRMSPLPNPNQNYQLYEINYQKYYIDTYNNVLSLWQKQQKQLNKLMKQFYKMVNCKDKQFKQNKRIISQFHNNDDNIFQQNVLQQQKTFKNQIQQKYIIICQKQINLIKLSQQLQSIKTQLYQTLQQQKQQYQKLIGKHNMSKDKDKIQLLTYKSIENINISPEKDNKFININCEGNNVLINMNMEQKVNKFKQSSQQSSQDQQQINNKYDNRTYLSHQYNNIKSVSMNNVKQIQQQIKSQQQQQQKINEDTFNKDDNQINQQAVNMILQQKYNQIIRQPYNNNNKTNQNAHINDSYFNSSYQKSFDKKKRRIRLIEKKLKKQEQDQQQQQQSYYQDTIDKSQKNITQNSSYLNEKLSKDKTQIQKKISNSTFDKIAKKLQSFTKKSESQKNSRSSKAYVQLIQIQSSKQQINEQKPSSTNWSILANDQFSILQKNNKSVNILDQSSKQEHKKRKRQLNVQ